MHNSYLYKQKIIIKKNFFFFLGPASLPLHQMAPKTTSNVACADNHHCMEPRMNHIFISLWPHTQKRCPVIWTESLHRKTHEIINPARQQVMSSTFDDLILIDSILSSCRFKLFLMSTLSCATSVFLILFVSRPCATLTIIWNDDETTKWG